MHWSFGGSHYLVLCRFPDLEMSNVDPGFFDISAGLCVGIFDDYGRAQRLYAKRGFIPDGRGVCKGHTPLRCGQDVRVDDDLLLWLTRNVKQRSEGELVRTQGTRYTATQHRLQTDRLDRSDLSSCKPYHRVPGLRRLYSFQPAANAGC